MCEGRPSGFLLHRELVGSLPIEGAMRSECQWPGFGLYGSKAGDGLVNPTGAGTSVPRTASTQARWSGALAALMA